MKWEEELNECDTQSAWDKIHNKITGLMERFIPNFFFTNTKGPPWYGRQINDLSKNKKRRHGNSIKELQTRQHGMSTPNIEIYLAMK